MADAGNYTPSGFILGNARVLPSTPAGWNPIAGFVPSTLQSLSQGAASHRGAWSDPPCVRCPSSWRCCPCALVRAELHDLPRYNLQFSSTTNELAIPPEGAYLEGVAFYLLFFVALAVILVLWAGCNCCRCCCKKE